MERRKGKRYYKLFINGNNVLKGKKATWCVSYDNEDYAYQTKGGYYHLTRDGVDLLKGKKARGFILYDNGDYRYETIGGEWIRFNKDHEEIR